MLMALDNLPLAMSEVQESERRAVEEEEPLKGQAVVKGPEWLRRLFVNGSRNSK